MTPPAEHLPDLDALALFVAVAETGSVGGAARRFGVSQPTASQRLRHLERRLGLVLLHRHPTGSTLTQDGRVVAEWADQLVTDGFQFTRNVGALSRKQDSRLRIAASLTIADHLVPTWLGALAEAEPDVTVSLQPANSHRVAELVRAGEADLGFVEGVDVPAQMQSLVVGHDDLVVVVSPEHDWASSGTTLTAGRLAAARLILREPGSGTRQVLDTALETLGLWVAPVMELGSTSLITRALARGGAASILSRLSVAADLEAGRLVEVRLDGISLTRELRAVWGAGRPPRGAAATLLLLCDRRRRPGPSRRSG